MEIQQGYLARLDETGGVEVRIRRRGDDRLLTVKGGEGLVRVEEEIEIGARRFDSLWPLTEGRRVEKRRHLLPLDGLVAEVDVFAGALEGFALVEVEFASEEDARRFRPPVWFGADVTGDRRYLNESLACAGAPDLGQLARRT